MNSWESISGAICFNVFNVLVETEPEKIQDLVFPLSCSLYLSAHWDELNFSKTKNIDELRPHITYEVSTMKDILLAIPDNIKDQIKMFPDNMNGSLAFSAVIISALFKGNEFIYDDNFRLLFQECWEIIFWFIQDLKDESLRNLICDFSDDHTQIFKQVIDINSPIIN